MSSSHEKPTVGTASTVVTRYRPCRCVLECGNVLHNTLWSPRSPPENETIRTSKQPSSRKAQTVPSNGTIRFLRTNNFAGFSFEWKRLEDIERFVEDRNGPDHEFLDLELEAARQRFRENCRALLVALATNTFPTTNQDRQAVPPEWEIEAPERFNSAVEEISAAADAVCSTYDDLVRLARKKLAV